MTPADSEASEAPHISPAAPALHYVSVTHASRPAALRRLLDDLDPPSATIVVRDAASEADAVQTIRSLGYRRASDPIRVTRFDAIPASHTVVMYDAPVMPSEIAAATAVGPVQIVALATPRDMVSLHELSDSVVPLTLDGPSAAARSHDALLREELAVILSQGAATRELLAVELLLDRYDGLEIAAAAIRLLELERTSRAKTPSQVLRLVPSRQAEPAPREPHGERGSRPARDSRDSRDSRDRKSGPPRGRDFGGPPRGGPPRSDRSEKKEWTPRPSRESAGGERRERDLGRGPRSGAGGRDDRGGSGGRSGGRPSGPPRRPRPFER